ncbi:hypothetical protein PC129_g21592 [Phytophthora cactorum]|uniref:Uncharacterized protein n=1 Tax=Phytophthora cactorum TaxID=29920 RepID=A0A8T1FVW9_9STRA|nr:hypothetical protein PC114_g12941 [Phytophthora cactorum]KAG2951554.1 hypothetical protein PC117_g3503 [Phytophthora cactorum]KAG2968117.1 hypothetical protein PC119_g24279 [Phytophthora cactorum]KAG2979425.1 hypothetical protein PC118_g11768 [Phytophthora cactorum]KAG3127720.1 hypothetical protein C6341_g24866 [Phytophthora cactorum]
MLRHQRDHEALQHVSPKISSFVGPPPYLSAKPAPSAPPSSWTGSGTRAARLYPIDRRHGSSTTIYAQIYTIMI